MIICSVEQLLLTQTEVSSLVRLEQFEFSNSLRFLKMLLMTLYQQLDADDVVHCTVRQ